MDKKNRTKQYLAEIEATLLRVESMLHFFKKDLHIHASSPYKSLHDAERTTRNFTR